MPRSVYTLIARHAAAQAALEHAADRIDTTLAAQEGRGVTTDDEKAWDSAELNEEQAFRAVLASVPSTTIELHRKIEYIRFHTRFTDTLDRSQISVLLQSFMSIRLPAA